MYCIYHRTPSKVSIRKDYDIANPNALTVPTPLAPALKVSHAASPSGKEEKKEQKKIKGVVVVEEEQSRREQKRQDEYAPKRRRSKYHTLQVAKTRTPCYRPVSSVRQFLKRSPPLCMDVCCNCVRWPCVSSSISCRRLIVLHADRTCSTPPNVPQKMKLRT